MMYPSLQTHINQALTVADAIATDAPDQHLPPLSSLDVHCALRYMNASMLPQHLWCQHMSHAYRLATILLLAMSVSREGFMPLSFAHALSRYCL